MILPTFVGPLSPSSSRKSKLPKTVYLGSFSGAGSINIRHEDSELASWHRDDRTQKVDEWKYVDVTNDDSSLTMCESKSLAWLSPFPLFT